jgi:hypothetical protein
VSPGLRGALLCMLLAAAGCDSGPTSDWPGDPNDLDDQGDEGPPAGADAGVSAMDAAKPAQELDAGAPLDDCPGDAGDAGCRRDF